MKVICISIIIALVFPLSANAEGQLLGAKTVGKLTMIAILLVTAAIVKILVDRDRKEVTRLHDRLGPPDGSVEFREGFDHWRVEWYGSRVYIFRNGVLYISRPEACPHIASWFR